MTLSIYTESAFPIQSAAHFLLRGPAGVLEVRTSMPTTTLNFDPPAIGVICHPHPLKGGTMDNKVVYTLAQAFKEMGYPSVCFNFRGIGASSGEYGHTHGELADLLAILQWLKQTNPQHTIHLAGFSFGSFIAARATEQWPIVQLVLVAPPVASLDFQHLPPFNCPWSVIQGEQDEVVPPAAVFDWFKHTSPPGECYRLPEASHFFHGQLLILRETMKRLLAKHQSRKISS
jgi:uncharacterized protein